MNEQRGCNKTSQYARGRRSPFLVKIAQGIEPRVYFPIQLNIAIVNLFASQPKETKGELFHLRRTFFGWKVVRYIKYAFS